MLNITQLFASNAAQSSSDSITTSVTWSRRLLIVVSVIAFGVVGCGQKGELYLVDASSQTVTGSSDVLESTSNPQDAAFAGIDDDSYQKERYLEQKQVLPGVTDDPNDY